VIERDGLGARAAFPRHLDGVRIAERGGPLHVGDLPLLRQLPEPGRQLIDDPVLEAAQPVQIHPGGIEGDAPGIRVLRFLEQLGDVE
jgi:hypothetical protein